MAKRGASGISRLLAIDKPVGMSSHDVVNRVRRIFGERRVGHCGTLDPLASGVLLVAVGPATRLDAFVAGHDKRYRMGVFFGVGTETDDAEGDVVRRMPVPARLSDGDFACERVCGLVGSGMQMPPVYSAVKVGGRKSYEAARRGTIIDLEPRPYEIYDAKLLDVRDAVREDGICGVEWLVEMAVSKGTYLRSIARDLGRSLKTCAYTSSLRRLESGGIPVEECVALDDLEAEPTSATIDPVRVLGVRFAFARECSSMVENGMPLPGDALSLNEPIALDMFAPCCCTSSVHPSARPPEDGEVVAVVVDNRLKALYEYVESQHRWKVRCVFSIGVERGTGL